MVELELKDILEFCPIHGTNYLAIVTFQGSYQFQGQSL